MRNRHVRARNLQAFIFKNTNDYQLLLISVFDIIHQFETIQLKMSSFLRKIQVDIFYLKNYYSVGLHKIL